MNHARHAQPPNSSGPKAFVPVFVLAAEVDLSQR